MKYHNTGNSKVHVVKHSKSNTCKAKSIKYWIYFIQFLEVQYYFDFLSSKINQFLDSFRKIAKSDYYIRHVCLSVFPPIRPSACVPVCVFVRPPAWNNSIPTKKVFIKIAICAFFENLYRKFNFH